MSRRIPSRSKRIKKQSQLHHNNNPYTPFDNLITNQEEQINEMDMSYGKIKYQKSVKILNHHEIQEQEEIDLEIQDIKKKDSEKMALLVGQLLAKNKINAKNAFQVPLLNLNQPQSTNDLPNDNLWKRFSSTLDSNQKIYGYRVDATHNYTYRVLQSITRQQKKEHSDFDQSDDRQQIKKQRYVENSMNVQFAPHQTDDFGKFLEKNYRNINIVHLDTFFNVNPVLEKTKRIFDQNGLKGLLFNNLQLNQELALRITLGKQKSTYFLKLKTKQPNPSTTTQQTLDQTTKQLISFDFNQINSIFRKMEYLCRLNNGDTDDSRQLIKKEYDEIEQLWRLLEEELVSQSDQTYVQGNRGLINNQLQMGQVKQEQPIDDYVLAEKQVQINDEVVPVDVPYHQNPQNPQNLQINLPFQPLLTNKLPQLNQPSQHQHQQSTIDPTDIQIISQIISDMLLTIQKQLDPFENTDYSILNPSNLIDQPSSNYNDPISKQSYSSFTPIKTQKSSNQTKKSSLSPPPSLSNKMNNRSFSKDFILRQIIDLGYDQGQHGNVVQKWKQSFNKRVKNQQQGRAKKQQKEKIPIRVNFYEEKAYDDGGCGVEIQYQSVEDVFIIDKSKKKQIKTLIKSMKKQKIIERNTFMNTSIWKINYHLKTYLKQFFLKDQNLSLLPLSLLQDQNQSLNSIPLYQSIEQSNIPQYIDISSMQHNIFDNLKQSQRNISIRQAKIKIHKMIFSQPQKSITFSQIYYKFHSFQGNISAALCFLTILHLTNQHGLLLKENVDEYDFTISFK